MTYEFECKNGHITEDMFCTIGQEIHTCDYCEETAKRIPSIPQFNAPAFRFWQGINDPHHGGYFSDHSKYHENLKRTGATPYEPGMDKDAENNDRYHVKKNESRLREIIANKMQNHTLDEAKAMVANEAKLAAAQQRGDIETIHKLGALASLDDAMAVAPKRPVAAHDVSRLKTA